MIEQYVTTDDGVRIFATETGKPKGTPVILCDGLACDGFIWRYLAPWLARDHRVIHWHYRGHGNSIVPWDHPNIGVVQFAKDMARVLDAFDVQAAHVFGHSMGCQVALEFALAAPRRALSLVPICGSYGRPLDTLKGTNVVYRAFPYLMRMVRKFPVGSQRFWTSFMGMDAVYSYAAAREAAGHLIRKEDFQPYFDHLARMDVRLFMRALDDVRDHTLEPRLAEIFTPTLVIAGERDTVTPLHLSERMAHLLPNAELLVVPEGSHVAPIEHHVLIEQRVQRFLSRLH